MNGRPQLVAPRTAETLEAVRSVTGGGFDPEAWHVMNERDDALIADEVLNGAGSSKFVYQFDMPGGSVRGISVVGARHLANAYGGLKHRLVSSTEKRGALFTFTSYPQAGMPMQVMCSVIPELEPEPDFYATVVEVTDIKTGNTIQVEARENRQERRRDGTMFDRPHFQKIAQAKGYRNAILALLPQDVQIEWSLKMLELKKGDVITRSVIDEKRAGILAFAAQKGIPLQRQAVDQLSMDQIAGLADAAREGLPAFGRSLSALGLMQTAIEADVTPPAADVKKDKGKGKDAGKDGPKAKDTGKDESVDPETGEVLRDGKKAGDTPPAADKPAEDKPAATTAPKKELFTE